MESMNRRVYYHQCLRILSAQRARRRKFRKALTNTFKRYHKMFSNLSAR